VEILISGCERSGTKMLSKSLGTELGIRFTLENKHTIACFKYYQELQRWVKYKDSYIPLNKINKFEKHTLNDEINIDFLKWIKKIYPNIKIYYIVRDGRSVVSSIIDREWGHSQTREIYKVSLDRACTQWNNVIINTWAWACRNTTIIKYEDICDIVSTPLDSSTYKIATKKMEDALSMTEYT
jgi:hypothetical protein